MLMLMDLGLELTQIGIGMTSLGRSVGAILTRRSVLEKGTLFD